MWRKHKVFCIGYNKTGTTSMAKALKGLGYRVGVQADAERLMDDWAIRDFRRIVRYCKTADAFQDVPFSLDFTYEVLDYAFPGSKFILTVRNSPEEWAESYRRFLGKMFGTAELPTIDQVKSSRYVAEGWMWRLVQNVYGIDETSFHDFSIYKAHYVDHNKRVLEYFTRRPADLLVLNLANPSSMKSLCAFLGVKYTGQVMPHKNKASA